MGAFRAALRIHLGGEGEELYVVTKEMRREEVHAYKARDYVRTRFPGPFRRGLV
jgi:hypothetical protein